MILIIPTYNRSAKLHRTLQYYSSVRHRLKCGIVVLDGSTGEHASWNKKNTERSDGIQYIKFDSEIPFLNRVLSFLESRPEEELIILGSDEDVFLPSYISDAAAFLNTHKNYSSYIGRYITLCRPILGLHRISHFRDYVTHNDISSSNPCRRLSILMMMLLVGCSPVYFSARRNRQLIKSIRCQLQLSLESAHEMVDQASLALTGKIKFVNKAMLLRDETNIGYQFYDTRHDPENYIDDRSLSALTDVISDNYNVEGLSHSLDLMTDLYCQIRDGTETHPSIAVSRHRNNYSSYRSLYHADSFTVRVIRNISRVGVIFSQVLSWPFIKRELLQTEDRSSISIFTRKVETHGKFPG